MSIVNGPIIFPKSEIASAIGVGRESFLINIDHGSRAEDCKQ